MQARKSCMVAAVVMAAAGFCFVTPVHAADKNDQNATQSQSEMKQAATGLPSLPPGSTAVTEPKKSAMAESLAEVTEQAAQKGSFDDVIDHFVDQDRDRMSKEGVKKNFDDVKQVASDLDKDFRNKYGKALNFQHDKDKSQVFADAGAVEGKIEDPATLLKSWPVDPTPQTKGANEAQPAAQTLQPGTHETKGDANIEKGRKIGIMRLPATSTLPAIDVSMIHEFGGWKIDVPNNRTGQMVHDDLMKTLTDLKAHEDQWPANIEDARRDFCHRVVMAIYGIPAQQGQHAPQ